MIQPLTQKQLRVYDFIVSFYKENRYMPNYRQIADSMGFASSNSVNHHVHSIIDKGYLMKIGEQISLTDQVPGQLPKKEVA